MATRRNLKTIKSRKNYKKSRKNYKRVRRGGQFSNYDEQREAISYNGPMDITKDPEYKRIDRMINFDKNFKKQQQNEISEGINKERLSQLTGLNEFKYLGLEKQKDVMKAFINSDTQKQDEIINYYKLLTQTNESQDIKKLKNNQQFKILSSEDQAEVVRAYLALPKEEKPIFLNDFNGGKTKKRRRNKKTNIR